jgi:hypothetical protein
MLPWAGFGISILKTRVEPDIEASGAKPNGLKGLSMPDENNSDQNSPILTMGWREWVGLPGICLPAIKAKIDTGARTSALHTFELSTFTQDGIDMVRFGMHPLQRRPNLAVHCNAPILDERVVSDSGGHRESRIVIETEIQVGGHKWPIELTLTNREDMLFRMLLGRKAMEGRVLVDPARSFILGRKLGRFYKHNPDFLTSVDGA